jgi:hypothetical protein
MHHARAHVRKAFAESLRDFDALYKELAKQQVATDYLTVADVLELHAELILRYGGAAGVRDPGALEAALFRPQSGYYDDIIHEAAALMEASRSTTSSSTATGPSHSPRSTSCFASTATASGAGR